MKTTERSALAHGTVAYDELSAVINERTLEILERRRKTATIRRRGWLIRRVLLGADVVGLTVAFALAEALWSANNHTGNGLGPTRGRRSG